MFWGLRFIDQGCSCFGVFVLLIRGVRVFGVFVS